MRQTSFSVASGHRAFKDFDGVLFQLISILPIESMRSGNKDQFPRRYWTMSTRIPFRKMDYRGRLCTWPHFLLLQVAKPTGRGFHHSRNLDQCPDIAPASELWEQEQAAALLFWERYVQILLAERVAGLTFENWPRTRTCWRESHWILTRGSEKPTNGISEIPLISLLPSDAHT